jgi:hypothetical protein
LGGRTDFTNRISWASAEKGGDRSPRGILGGRIASAFGDGAEPVRSVSSCYGTLGFLVLAAVAIAATVVGRGFTALLPGDDDALLFAYIGEQIANGQILYRDLWDNKPPGIFVVNALAAYFTDWSFLFLAALEGVLVLAAIGCTYAFMRTAGAPRIPTAIAVAGAALSCNLAYFTSSATSPGSISFSLLC